MDQHPEEYEAELDKNSNDPENDFVPEDELLNMNTENMEDVYARLIDRKMKLENKIKKNTYSKDEIERMEAKLELLKKQLKDSRFHREDGAAHYGPLFRKLLMKKKKGKLF